MTKALIHWPGKKDLIISRKKDSFNLNQDFYNGSNQDDNFGIWMFDHLGAAGDANIDWKKVGKKEKTLKNTPIILWSGDDTFDVPVWDGDGRDKDFDYDWIVNGMKGKDNIGTYNHSQDYFRGGKDDDYLYGGEDGNDALFGDLGDDTLFSSRNGISLMRGGPGKDILNSNPNRHRHIKGLEGEISYKSDFLIGDPGKDILNGGIKLNYFVLPADNENLSKRARSADVIRNFDTTYDYLALPGVDDYSQIKPINVASKDKTFLSIVNKNGKSIGYAGVIKDDPELRGWGNCDFELDPEHVIIGDDANLLLMAATAENWRDIETTMDDLDLPTSINAKLFGLNRKNNLFYKNSCSTINPES